MANVRFAYNNIGLASASTLTVSSFSTGFPGSNLEKENRHEYWKASDTNGTFPVDAANNKIYINDGTDKTVTVASSDYAGGTALATAAQTALNTASSGWTVSYAANKFTMAHATATMQLSNRTNALWDTIGFESTTNATVSVTGVTRYNWFEFIHFDLATAHEITFCALLHPSTVAWPLSSSAVVTLEGNNIDSFSSPAVTKTLESGTFGAMEFLAAGSSYRYWRLKISDPENPDGLGAMRFGHVFLGDYLEPSGSTLARGFSESYIDQSSVVSSISGTRYFNERPTFRSYRGLQLQYLEGTDYTDFRDFTYEVGIADPFWMIIDPAKSCFTTLGEQSVFGRFPTPPIRNHFKTDTWSLVFDVEEIV